jgi:hypothetical protein
MMAITRLLLINQAMHATILALDLFLQQESNTPALPPNRPLTCQQSPRTLVSLAFLPVSQDLTTPTLF